MELDGITGGSGISTQTRMGHYSSGAGQNIKVNNKEDANYEPPRVAKKKQPGEMKEQKFTEDEIIDKIQQANNKIEAYDRKFQFSIHEKTNQIMVKIVDSVTDEVIRELPPEKVLDIVAGIWEVAGILVDNKI